MKRFLTVAVAIVALSGATAMAGLQGGPHDFSSSTWNTSGQVCMPCHIPHHSNATIGYLWNHEVPDDSDFTNKAEDAVLGAESLTCLGCHDGVTALDAFGGATGSTTLTGSANLGRDMADDHPVGIEYPSSDRFATKGTVHGHAGIPIGYAGLMLFGADDTIECATCHTPHSNDNSNFLRVNNTGSALCIACHTSWW